MFFKTATPSIYLDVTRKNPNRKTLVKFRISNHKLNIEKQADMIRFRDVIQSVLFVASILKMRLTFCLIVQNLHLSETAFLVK